MPQWVVLMLGHVSITGGGGVQDATEGLAWFVQVSDIHLSRFAERQMPQFGDKEGDFGHLAAHVLKPIAPGALVSGSADPVAEGIAVLDCRHYLLEPHMADVEIMSVIARY